MANPLFLVFTIIASVVCAQAQNTCSSPVTQGEKTCAFDLNAWSNVQPVSGKLEEPFRPYGCYWVCNGDTLILNGASDFRVWAESGAYIFLDTTSAIPLPTSYSGAIWLKDGATLDMIDNAGFYTANATIIREQGSIVTQPSIFTNVENCANVTFNYPSSFPSGCDTTHVTPTGFWEINQEVGFTIAPNPTSGELHVQGLKFKAGNELLILDVMGKEVYHTKLSKETSNLKLQTSTIENGVYFLQLKAGENILTRKLIVQH